MKNKILLFTISIFLFVSCSDWTEIESLDMPEPSISEQNPELYAEYLKNVREFKNSDHKLTYVSFDNSEKVPFSRAHRIVDLPDSIDVISLMHPDNLADWEIAEMKSVRENKNMKVIFTMNFDEMKSDFNEMIKVLEDKEYENEEDRPALPQFIPFLVDSVNHTLSLVSKYKYDGISLAYKGMSIFHMTNAEKTLHKTYEKAFIGIAEDWQERNQDKMIVFEGYPQNLLNKSILKSCDNIILPVTNADNKLKLAYELNSAQVENVPTDRFIIATSIPSLDLSDKKTGYWADASRALQNTAIWVLSPQSGSEIAGIAVHNVSNDYFNTDKAYKYTRNAINKINPSPKK